jgi:predicted ATPase/Tfp pilus assembly protein PilF
MTPRWPHARFFGREDDIVHLRELRRAGVRMVTLWGPAGIGKTRLAMELCQRAVREGEQVWFCDLAAARTAADVAIAVADELPRHDGETSVPPLHPAVRDPLPVLRTLGPGLLVLDHFDHLAEHALATVGTWAEAAPEIAFLVTSRERLRLAGEVTHELEPLGPEAVQLFLDRADQVERMHRDRLDPARVAELVAGLEGNPLAIELAAARLDLLGLDGLLERLARPLELLGHGARDACAHHATLWRAIDWSYRLLKPPEQRVLVQCAVFAGGFSVAAAEAVLEAGPGAAVLDVLQALRDRSFLRRQGSRERTRFALHGTVRAYAEEALAAQGDVASLRLRHARHYLRAAPALAPADQANLAAAIAWSLSQAPSAAPVDSAAPADSAAPVDSALAALTRLEPSRTSDRLLELYGRALATARVAPVVRAGGHRARGRALQLHGRLAEARAELERALELADPDAEIAGEIWTDLGVLYHQQRELARARAAYVTALERLGPAGDPVARARGTGNLGAVHHDVGEFDDASACYREALSGFRVAGEHRLEGIFLTNLGVLLQERGEQAPAHRLYLEALDRLGSVGDRRLEAITHTNLGLLCQEMGEPVQARTCHERALFAFHEVIDPRSTALCLGRFALALAALGHVDDARRDCGRAAEQLARLGDRVGMAVLGLFRAHVELSADAPGAEAAARSQVAAARAAGGADEVALCELSDDARAAVRLIEVGLAARRAELGHLLRVGPAACWFASGGGAREDLSGQRVLRRLLLGLVEQHLAAPGEGLPLDALREVGWPGERILRGAAVNRVHVALSKLRRLGLRSFLVCRDGRYFIDPAAHVEISAS